MFNSATDAGTLDGGDHGLAAALDGAHAVLHVGDHVSQLLLCAGRIGMTDAPGNAGQQREIYSGAEVFAVGGKHHHPYGIVAVGPFEGAAHRRPHRRVERVGVRGTVEGDACDTGFERQREVIELGDVHGQALLRIDCRMIRESATAVHRAPGPSSLNLRQPPRSLSLRQPPRSSCRDACPGTWPGRRA